MKNFLCVLFALALALLASGAYAGCQQQVLALRQVQPYVAQLQAVQVYGQQFQQLNTGCYVQQVQQLQHVQRVQVQQLNNHHNQQLLIVRPQRQQVIIQREALFPRLRAR